MLETFCSDDPPEIFNMVYKFEEKGGEELQEIAVHILSLEELEEMCPEREVDHPYLKLYGTYKYTDADHQLERVILNRFFNYHI